MALTATRWTRLRTYSSLDLPCKNEQVYKGGLACGDRSTGLVAKGFASVNLVPLGTYADDKLVTGNAKCTIDLFREIRAIWMTRRSAWMTTRTHCPSWASCGTWTRPRACSWSRGSLTLASAASTPNP
jgi:hypothetical protein